MTFRIFWTIDALVALIFASFFVIGLADGSVSSFNLALWVSILLGLIALLGGSHVLHGTGRKSLALALAGLLAVPGILAGLLFVAMLLSNPRWN